MSSSHQPKLPLRFAAAYGAATAGATIAFLPLLVLILPLKAEQISPDNKLQLLSLALLCGAITASIANIAAGWVSDRLLALTGSRIAQIAIGLIAVLVSYAVFAQVNSTAGLVAAVVLFQTCLNAMYSPLGALLADKVPHDVKGRMSALLNLGLPIAALSIAFLSLPLFESEAQRLIALGAIVSVLVLPLIVVAQSQPDLIVEDRDTDDHQQGVELPNRELRLAWIGRFAMQMSGAVVFGYILYFLQDALANTGDTAASTADQALGQITLTATPVAIVMGLAAGYLSDKLRARKAFLLGGALAIALSLGAMAVWPSWIGIYAGYVVFSAALTLYLTIDAAVVSQLLERSTVRGRTLGFMNLTNTMPAILAPTLAIALNSQTLSQSDLNSLFQIAAGTALIGVVCVSRLRLHQ